MWHGECVVRHTACVRACARARECVCVCVCVTECDELMHASVGVCVRGGSYDVERHKYTI